MSRTITIRLTPELADWLEETAKASGVPQGRILREQLQRAKREAEEKSFLELAGAVSGPTNLSARKGFSKK